MGYILNATAIRAPAAITETNSTQMAMKRTLSGAVNRDFFGTNKRIWQLDYKSTKKADYDIINAIYNTYLLTGNTVTWQSTETNYSFASTLVHVDLLSRGFSIKGNSYISDFSLILTEA